MKKIILSLLFALIVFGGYFLYDNNAKVLLHYQQLTQERVGSEVDLRNDEQKDAHFVGSAQCIECHEENHSNWSHSRHPKMIQDIKKI